MLERNNIMLSVVHLLLTILISSSVVYFAMPIVESLAIVIDEVSTLNICIAALFYILAQICRFLRFQYICLERERGFIPLLNLFSFSTLVASLFPYKVGDLVRIYIFQRYFKSVSLGFVIVVIERFFDTVVLLGLSFAPLGSISRTRREFLS